MYRHLLAAVVRVCAVVALCCPAAAIRPAPGAAFPADFDLRAAADGGDLAQARDRVAARFAMRFGAGLHVHWGDRSERPLYVHRPGSVLAVAPGSRDAVQAARLFLRWGEEAFGFTDAEIDALDAAKVYDTPGLGVTHVQFLQRVDGISVFRGQVRVNLDGGGGVLNVGGEYFPGLRVTAPPKIGADTALRAAAAALGLSGSVPASIERQPGGERRTTYAAGGEYLEPPVARLVLLPEGRGAARLVWEVVIHEAVSGWDNEFRTLVDAASGEPVLRELMTLYAGPTTPADATGVVFDCEDPGKCGQTTESLAGDPAASPLNWVEDGQTLTQGNNVASRTDWNGFDPGGTDTMANGGRQLAFDFPFTNGYELNGDLFADSDAGITNAFYWGNLIHDHWHALGFDETAGNYQQDNFGLGGLGGDRVNVDVQDSAAHSFVRNNANWSPTNDGSQPRTNYFMWTTPDRDGAFDAGVIWHEFGHGLSTRLVGGPSTQCLNGAQGGGMGEGWSDWLAVNFFADPADDPAGPAIVGEYVTGNSQRGIRRYPYHHDLAINPLTYADLCDGGSCEVHDEGEIWAQVLWDVRHDLIQAHGFADGRLRAEQLVIDGMKLSPCSPNMVVMRDAILEGDVQRYGGADSCLLRSAFARRGLGVAAFSNGTGADASADFATILPVGASVLFGVADDELSWSAEPGAVAYRVARGDFGPDASVNLFDDAACLGQTAATSFQDAAVPASDHGFYYLVAQDDDCFRSHFGTDGAGNVRAVSDCP